MMLYSLSQCEWTLIITRCSCASVMSVNHETCVARVPQVELTWYTLCGSFPFAWSLAVGLNY
jgi:hypothetical protein